MIQQLVFCTALRVIWFINPFLDPLSHTSWGRKSTQEAMPIDLRFSSLLCQTLQQFEQTLHWEWLNQFFVIMGLSERDYTLFTELDLTGCNRMLLYILGLFCPMMKTVHTCTIIVWKFITVRTVTQSTPGSVRRQLCRWPKETLEEPQWVLILLCRFLKMRVHSDI